jgi:TRAP-type C4-dicarboxylate transport system permease small subunit
VEGSVPAPEKACPLLQRLDAVIVRVNEVLLVASLVSMAVIVFANVVGRALTGQSFGWGSEVARQLLVWMVMLSVGLVLRRGGHLALTLVFTAVSEAAARWLKRLVLVLVILFAAYAIWAGVGYAMLGRFQSSPVIGVPYVYVYAAIPTGFALLIYHALASWREFVASRDDADVLRGSGA